MRIFTSVSYTEQYKVFHYPYSFSVHVEGGRPIRNGCLIRNTLRFVINTGNMTFFYLKYDVMFPFCINGMQKYGTIGHGVFIACN